jgi:phosphoribosylaminoimidazole carboxylase (NCAIR synthetase)
VNDSRALRLEISKVAQYEALAAFGIATPETLAVIGRESIVAAAERLGYPLILKHNRGGKGLGVRLFLSRAALEEHVASPAADQHRLAHSVAPEDSEDLPLPEPNRETLEHLDGAVATVDVAGLQHH